MGIFLTEAVEEQNILDQIIDMVLKMPSYKMIMMIASVVLLILSLVLIVIPSVRQKVIELEGLKTIKREDFVKQVRNRYVSDKFDNAIARYLDDAYKYSRVYQKDPTRTSFDFFRNTILMGVIAFIIFGLLTTIMFGALTFFIVIVIRYGYLSILRFKNNREVESEVVLFLNMLGNYSTGNSEIISIFAAIAHKFKPVLQTCLMECVAESQGTEGTIKALDNLGRKIESRKFKEVLKSLEISQRFSGGFGQTVNSLRRDAQGFLAEKKKLNELIKQNLITLCVVVGAILIMIYVLGQMLNENVWMYFTEPIGIGCIIVLVLVCLWFASQLIKINN